MKSSEYFEFKLPHKKALHKEYQIPYRFKEDLLAEIDRVFMSPRHKWHAVYAKHRWSSDRNEMAQVLWLYVRYGRDNMASIGGSLDNIKAQIAVAMWKKMLGTNKRYKRVVWDKYYSTHVGVLHSGVGRLIELMIKVQDDGAYWQTHGDMRKHDRPARNATQEGSKRFEYYANTE